MQLADDITADDLKVFIAEAEEQLQLLDDQVIQLEKESTEDGLASIFRAAHTLKGSSAMLGYTAMSRVAHAMKTLLDKLRNGEVSVTPELVDALLHSLDALRVLTDELIEERRVVRLRRSPGIRAVGPCLPYGHTRSAKHWRNRICCRCGNWPDRAANAPYRRRSKRVPN